MLTESAMSCYIVSLVFDINGAEKAQSLDINGASVHFTVIADSYAKAIEISSEGIADYEKLGITFEYVIISAGKEVAIKIGDFVTKFGDDAHIVVDSICGGKKITTVCTKPPINGLFVVGDYETNLSRRWIRIAGVFGE